MLLNKEFRKVIFFVMGQTTSGRSVYEWADRPLITKRMPL